ncbi:MAG: prolipoprotein diacylglyceryl transferase [Candidatus Omnitrophica bacterium]|nr:prolipoprotein diacylglyceryl transferase [Candidatus Omnitrophota bacterium]
MHPVLFEIGTFKVYSYGAALAIAFLLATSLARRKAASEGMDGDKVLDLCIVLIISGIAGARLLFVLLNIDAFTARPADIFKLWEGGLVWYGGLISAAAGALVFMKANRMPALKTADIVAPYIALGQAIGRIGCFLNGCCYGKHTDLPIGVSFPGIEGRVIPTQIIESGAMFVIFFVLSRRRPSGGRTFILYLLLYSCFRFLNEFLRGDNPAFFAGLTVSQVISVAIFALAALLWKIIPSK